MGDSARGRSQREEPGYHERASQDINMERHEAFTWHGRRRFMQRLIVVVENQGMSIEMASLIEF